MLFSCSNPDAIVQAMGSDDTLSGIMADSVVFYRSDSGIVNLELHTPRMIRHADYGKNYGKMRLIEAQGNVIVQNFGSNETMYSDKLFWYQDLKMIYTRSHVKIVTPDKQIEADSLVAREDFSEYTMYSGSALLDVDEED